MQGEGQDGMWSKARTKAKVQSINVSGDLREIQFAGRNVITGFFKSAVEGPAIAHALGLKGDAQGNLSVHGGLDKAVYVYPEEHYAQWEELLGSGPLTPGSFGENVTSDGWLETDVCIGDVIRIGTATLQVVQPRSPCYKLQIRFNRPDMTAVFFQQGKPGWYASVLQAGTFCAGNEMLLLERAPENVSIADIWHSSVQRQNDAEKIATIMNLELLPRFWKERIAHQLVSSHDQFPMQPKGK